MASSFPPAASSAAVTAVQVGNYFLSQYYQMLQSNPDYVHRFYSEQSKMIRIDGPEVETATATLEIHSLVMSLNFSSIEIKTAHSVDSWNDGVLVMVSGSVQIKEFGSRRKFAQTFFLAPQEKGYFVLNDIIQFFDEEQLISQQITVGDHENYDSNITVPEPEHEYALGGGIQDEDFPPSINAQESEAVDKYSISEPQLSIPEVEDRPEVKVEEASVSIPVAVPIPVPVSQPALMDTTCDFPAAVVEDTYEEPVKHTYASILRTKVHSAPVPPQPILSKNSEWDQAPQPPAPADSSVQPSAASERSTAEPVDDIQAFDDEVGEVTSVYVRNLPSSASASELEQEFRNFGRIKPGGVLIKSRKEAGVYYAFVEFEDLSGVQNSVKASPILYKGRQIYVEERRPTSIAARARRGRGRSSYQYESSRGRFGSSGRSYGRVGTEDSREYGNTRSRGNGYHQRSGSRQA